MGKMALITGASEGIGKVFAIRLAKSGYQITAVARRENKLKELIQTLGASHQVLAADLSTSEGQNLVAKKLEMNKYDILVNNAGVGTVGAFTQVPLDKQMAMIRLNCEALVVLSHAFLKNAKEGDSLLNVSSTLAFLPMPMTGLYCATKAFVTSLSESLWYEQRERGVYVMGLCPGVTSTNFQINAGGKKEDIPANMAQSAEEVVDYAMKHLECRYGPTVISGSKNKTFAFMTRLMTRKTVVHMMGQMTKSRSKSGDH